jgi:hypothetical protein
MLGLVCNTYNCIKDLEIYDNKGIINKKEGIHRLAGTIGRPLDGRFTVFCLENIRCHSILNSPILHWTQTV